MLCPSSVSRFMPTVFMTPAARRRAARPALSFVLLVEKPNSDHRMTLKLVEDLYFSALKCGFA